MDRYHLVKNIYLFRHGETDHNIIHRSQGCEIESILTDNGKQQAMKLGNYLLKYSPFDLVVSSGLIRANQTADIIANIINYTKPILIIDNFKEKCNGEISGTTKEERKTNPKFDKMFELEKKYDEELDPIKKREIFYQNNIILNQLYNSELLKTFRHRIKKGLIELYNRTEKNIIVISHGGTITDLLRILTGIDDMIEISGNKKNGTNCLMSYLQVFEKTLLNNKIKQKIKIIKLLTIEHL